MTTQILLQMERALMRFTGENHPVNWRCPNEQVALINDVLLNIYLYAIPRKVETIRPHQASWIIEKIQIFLRKKRRAYKNFMENGKPIDELDEIQQMISDGSKMIEDTKRTYFLKAGCTWENRGTSKKNYWSLINTVLNKAMIPIIPLLLDNDLYISDFTEKAHIFNEYCLLQ